LLHVNAYARAIVGGTVALFAVAVVLGGLLVARFVWVVPLAVHLSVR